jgi:hypothetical protein
MIKEFEKGLNIRNLDNLKLLNWYTYDEFQSQLWQC